MTNIFMEAGEYNFNSKGGVDFLRGSAFLDNGF